MLIIKSNYDSYTINVNKTNSTFQKNDIVESKKILEHIIYTLGLNTDSNCLEVIIK